MTLPRAGRPTRSQVFLALITGGLLAAGFIEPGEPEHTSNGALVEQVLAKVRRSYVDPVSPKRLDEMFHTGLNEMVQTLDHNTRYVPPEDVLDFQGDTDGSYIGIGIVLDANDSPHPSIGTVIHGGPAARVGILEGDVILAVDGDGIDGLGLDEISRRLKGLPGTRVSLRIARRGLEVDLMVPRGRVETSSVSAVRLYEAADGAAKPIGYVRLKQFQDGSLEELRQASQNLLEGGAESLVLDLRYNGGGILEQAVDIARLFLQEGHVLTTRGRSDWDHPRMYSVNQPGPFAKIPLAVLVDGGTASSAEIVSAALRDHNRTLLVGQETYGKWTVQTIYPLGHDATDGILKLTTRRHYPPKGFGIREDEKTHVRRGLLPDIEASLDDKSFAQLFRAWRREEINRVNTPFAVDHVPLPSANNTETFPPAPKRSDEDAPTDNVVDAPLLTALAILADPPRYWEQIAAQRKRWESNAESDEVNTAVAKEQLEPPSATEPHTPPEQQ
ncbi:MAG: S41 family peptidase [Planctomycetota bacterium]